MITWLETRNRNNPNAMLREMRIGIHTGPVVAGVIGKNKFAYDIWGDAVNLAARLEEHGEHGKVNVSGATAEAVRHLFPVEPRGTFSVHNKGEVEMFFVQNNDN
jgi:class 3 adenylate cyclase